MPRFSRVIGGPARSDRSCDRAIRTGYSHGSACASRSCPMSPP